MGLISSASTVSLIAKLTPKGREMILTNSPLSSITKFSLGDSDSNYFANDELGTGYITDVGGSRDTTSCDKVNVWENLSIRNRVFLSSGVEYFKSVNAESGVLVKSVEDIPISAYTGVTSATFLKINRNNLTNNIINLFRSVNLPVSQVEKTIFTSGSFKDTAVEGFNKDDVLLGFINKDLYGEVIDGKTLKIRLPVNTGATVVMVDFYATYSRNPIGARGTNDAAKSDTLSELKGIGDNIALIFSDNILKPNASNSKSWVTGYGVNKPFLLGNKETFNYKSSVGFVLDEPAGFIHLDKGVIVFTHPYIVTGLSTSQSVSVQPNGTTAFTHSITGVTLSMGSSFTNIGQQIICEASINEFYRSSNPTFSGNDNVRISEIGLYNNNNDLIAIAKPDRHVVKRKSQIKLFAVEIKI